MFEKAHRFGDRLRWLLVLLAVVLASARCNGPHPPLPATPAGPVTNVAILSPTTGELASQGQTLRNGVQLAFDEWNNKVDNGQPRLESIPYHTNCTFESAEQAIRQAIKDGVQFLVGPLCSEAAIAAAVEAAAAGALLIAPAAPHLLVTRDQTGKTRPTVFGIAYTPDWQAYNAARFSLTTLNIGRAAVLEPGGDRYGSSLASFFTTHYQAMGGTVVFTATIEAATEDLTQVLTSGSEAGAQLLYLPGSTAYANTVAGQLRQSGDLTGLTVLGSDAWHAPSLDLDATAGSYFPVHYTPLNPAPEIQNWRASYKSTFAVEPDPLAALGFDAANVLAEGIRHATSLTPDDVAASLEKLEFEGVTGTFQFDVHHNPQKTINFLRVRDQSLVLYDEP